MEEEAETYENVFPEGLGSKALGKSISISSNNNLINSNRYKHKGSLRSSGEQAISDAQGKLDAQPILKKIPFKARRKLRRLIAFTQTKEIIITQDRLVMLNLAKSGVKGQSTVIMDSGTMYHISRNKNDFCNITNERIRITGIAGGSFGYHGYLKQSALGMNIQAIYYKDLPVEALISLEKLKEQGWETELKMHENAIVNIHTGAKILMKKCPQTGLPIISVNFSEKPISGLVYSPTQEEEDLPRSSCNTSENVFLCPEVPQQTNPNPNPNPLSDLNTVKIDNNSTEATGLTRSQTPTPNPKESRKRKRAKLSPKEKQDIKKKIKVSKLLQHQRMNHMHEPDNKVRCLDCMESKGKRGGARKERPEEFKTRSPFLLFSADFFGQVKPQSIQGNNWVLAFICDECAFAHAECIRSKRDAPAALERFTKEIRRKTGVTTLGTGPVDIIVGGIHTDNEPVLTGQRWKETCDRLGITELHSIPYVPQGNGTIERFVGTLKNSLRTSMRGVDSRCWDWCVQNCIETWNMKNNKKCCQFNDGLICCPNEILTRISKNPFVEHQKDRRKHLRRFGCLAFFKPYRSPTELQEMRNKVLLPTRKRGIMLGFSPNNSAWLIGSVNEAGVFATYETRDVSFCEDILVSDVRALSIRWEPDLSSFLDPTKSLNVETSKSTTVGTGIDPVAGECADYDSQGRNVSRWEVPAEESKISLRKEDYGLLREGKPEGPTRLKENIRDNPTDLDILEAVDVSTPLLGEDPKSKIDVDRYKQLVEQKQDCIKKGIPLKTTLSSGQDPKGVRQPDDDEDPTSEVTFGPTAEIKRRGRPRGSKDLQKRTRKTKKQMRQEPKAGDTKIALAMHVRAEETRNFYSHLAMEDDEEIEEVHIFLAKDGPLSQPGDSVKCSWAFSKNNPERPKWIEAKEKEEVRLKAYNCWRQLSEEEEIQWRQGKIKAIPTALLLNRKRCGRYKGRLVVLGNRWEPTGDNSVYAGVVSQVGNRATLIHAAKKGMEVIPFDIGNAFIRASMENLKVVVTLPESFRDTKQEDNGRRMLLKALYGLPISPRLWAKTLGKDLKTLGWVECKNEPGVWRKHHPVTKEIHSYLTVYVDDCVLCSIDKKTVNEELKLIHDKHPLSVIKCDPTPTGGKTFDLTGADIDYNASKNTVKISMKTYIEKMLRKFDMLEAKPLATPSFEEKMLYDPKSKKCDFDFRSAVGALQWAATCGRPDISHATNTLARACANPCNTSMAKATRIVFRYLLGTLDYAIEYNPTIEKEFYAEFDKILVNETENEKWTKDAKKQKDKELYLFTDASFGVAYKSMKSVSGIAVYLHGCIIAWRSKVQTIMTNCTTQSEWVALSDGIEFSSTIYGLDLFLKGENEGSPHQGPIITDNRGAALIGRKGPENVEEIPRRSRHVCLKYAHVLDNHSRLFWCPTTNQKADGLTKSGNPEALRSLLNGTSTKEYLNEEVQTPELADELTGVGFASLMVIKGTLDFENLNCYTRQYSTHMEIGYDSRTILQQS